MLFLAYISGSDPGVDCLPQEEVGDTGQATSGATPETPSLKR